MLGVQAYIINGVRQRSKKTGSKEMLFQPGNLLQVVAYYHQQKNLNRLKEYEYACLYKSINQSVVKNALLLFTVELTHKCLHEPSPMPEVFHLLSDMALLLDATPQANALNYALIYALQLAQELGFGIQGQYTTSTPFFNFIEGAFVANYVNDTITASNAISEGISNLSQALFLNSHTVNLSVSRKILLTTILYYIQLHQPAVQYLRSPEILHSIFE